jgi:phosphoribosylformylglycinamidine (FGAM) synthase-like enzyme
LRRGPVRPPVPAAKSAMKALPVAAASRKPASPAFRCPICVFLVHPQPWEVERPLPPRMASAFEIMRDGPLGAAAFNNEFGRPCLGGYFRTYEHETGEAGLRRGYDKPIMLAGGLANLRPGHVLKRAVQPGNKVIVLGGPAMLIGLGGGAASSVASGIQRGARFRLGAARQRRNGTALPGSHRRLLASRR